MAPPRSVAEALAMRLRRRCIRHFGQEEYRRDKTGVIKGSEYPKMDIYHGVKDVEVGSPHALDVFGKKPNDPDIDGAWVFSLSGKGAHLSEPYSAAGLPPFQQRETLWRIEIFVTPKRHIFYRVVNGKPPKNLDAILECAIAGP